MRLLADGWRGAGEGGGVGCTVMFFFLGPHGIHHTMVRLKLFTQLYAVSHKLHISLQITCFFGGEVKVILEMN